jgi:BRCT domain type II-containing protein
MNSGCLTAYTTRPSGKISRKSPRIRPESPPTSFDPHRTPALGLTFNAPTNALISARITSPKSSDPPRKIPVNPSAYRSKSTTSPTSSAVSPPIPHPAFTKTLSPSAETSKTSAKNDLPRSTNHLPTDRPSSHRLKNTYFNFSSPGTINNPAPPSNIPCNNVVPAFRGP